ncbi:MAG TPA: HlyD family efflux transporter periplasmic adaptor subunit, partial [Polyangia bacterium]|nr:HlyD family efflux transporter periplasmic adaptor subunit [Polyangia bacterium]
RWIPAQTEGRVERHVILPGTPVKADSVILELSNPELELQALEAESRLRAAEASYSELAVRLKSQRLDQEAAAARVQADYRQAQMQADADAQLAKQGLVADLNLKVSQVKAEELSNRDRIEKERLHMAGGAIEAQLAVQRAQVEQRKALANLRRTQVKALRVVAGIAGVLQRVEVEMGQRIGPGANLARVAQPTRLKAVVRIGETQARDVQIGQSAVVDTRAGIVPARVTRVDPSAQNGTVGVDLAMDGPLPKGARPDLTVDGTIELERLADVIKVERPAQSQPESDMTLFRLEPDGSHAVRVKVRLGRASVSEIEVREGLKPGDQVILSDTQAWDGFDRLRLN